MLLIFNVDLAEGEYIDSAISNAMRLAIELKVMVRFRFGKIKVDVSPFSSVSIIREKYDKAVELSHETALSRRKPPR